LLLGVGGQLARVARSAAREPRDVTPVLRARLSIATSVARRISPVKLRNNNSDSCISRQTPAEPDRYRQGR